MEIQLELMTNLILVQELSDEREPYLGLLGGQYSNNKKGRKANF